MSFDLVAEVETETQAALRIMGDELLPDLVTQALGVAPDRSCKKVDPRKKPRYAPYRHGLWLRYSRCSPSDSLQEHLKDLIEFCRDRQSSIKELQEQGHGTDISVGIFSSDINIEFYLDHQLLQDLGNLGLALKFDNYADTGGQQDGS